MRVLDGRLRGRGAEAEQRRQSLHPAVGCLRGPWCAVLGDPQDAHHRRSRQHEACEHEASRAERRPELDVRLTRRLFVRGRGVGLHRDR